jgi:hypothetical protein
MYVKVFPNRTCHKPHFLLSTHYILLCEAEFGLLYSTHELYPENDFFFLIRTLLLSVNLVGEETKRKENYFLQVMGNQ